MFLGRIACVDFWKRDPLWGLSSVECGKASEDRWGDRWSSRWVVDGVADVEATVCHV